MNEHVRGYICEEHVDDMIAFFENHKEVMVVEKSKQKIVLMFKDKKIKEISVFISFGELIENASYTSPDYMTLDIRTRGLARVTNSYTSTIYNIYSFIRDFTIECLKITGGLLEGRRNGPLDDIEKGNPNFSFSNFEFNQLMSA